MNSDTIVEVVTVVFDFIVDILVPLLSLIDFLGDL